MTSVPADQLVGSGTGQNTHIQVLDAELHRAVRRTSAMRQLFYVVVLLVALAGQVSGAVQRLHIPVLWAIPAVAALELGGVVVMANADVRRRVGERAIASRVLSALVAAGAVAFNWFAHPDHLLGGFFAGMSALGYCVWLMHIENQRRDRLRATGDLPPTTPAYELVEHWLRHPALTLHARSLAKAHPGVGLYESLDAARNDIHRRRRQAAISLVLHRKIRAAVDPATADIAVAVYDLDEIARRLAANADYDTLTQLLNADLAPERLTTDVHTHSNHHDTIATTQQPPAVDPTIHERDAEAVPAAASPVEAAGTPPVPSVAPPPPPPAYEPTSEEDAAMYRAWRHGVVAGQEPTGADLARAAGRADDATGIGRRAARRYRDAHAAHPISSTPWQSNGHALTTNGATP